MSQVHLLPPEIKLVWVYGSDAAVVGPYSHPEHQGSVVHPRLPTLWPKTVEQSHMPLCSATTETLSGKFY